MQTINEFLNISIGGFTVGKLLWSVAVLVICVAASKLLLRVAGRAVEKLNVEKTMHAFIRSALKVVLYFLSLIITLGVLGIPVTSLIAAFSVVSLAVSLAVQGILSNIASGLQILTTKPFKTGDFVELNGISGTVKEINLVHTHLVTPDNKVIFVPNSGVTAAQIINYSALAQRRIDIAVTASYDAPVDAVKAALLEAAEKTPGVLKEPEPFAGVTRYGDSAIEYLLRVWTETGEFINTSFALTEAVKRSFDTNGIEMTYNHLNIHLKKD